MNESSSGLRIFILSLLIFKGGAKRHRNQSRSGHVSRDSEVYKCRKYIADIDGHERIYVRVVEIAEGTEYKIEQGYPVGHGDDDDDEDGGSGGHSGVASENEEAEAAPAAVRRTKKAAAAPAAAPAAAAATGAKKRRKQAA